jgi:hypothetical protein
MRKRESEMKKIIVITGHYGSGKTNISANLAIKLSKAGEKVTVVDLDIVNPYFRTADFGDLFEKNNITLISSMYANTNLDIPAISFDVERLATEDGYLIIDVGGDETGATALGRYHEPFMQFKNDIDMLYVVNCYRYMTRFSDEALELFHDIERTARFSHTGIINNSNLGEMTTARTVLDSLTFAKEVSEGTGLPIIFTAAPRSIKCDELNEIAEYVDIYVKPLWAE